MIRPDAALKVEGRAEFGADLARSGMLWAALVRSPVTHGRLRAIDASAALRDARVRGVVTGADLASLLGGKGDPARPIFPIEELRYLGEPVAGVVATTREAAYAAVRSVRVDAEPLPAVVDIEQVFPEWPGRDAAGSPHVNAYVRARTGDFDAAFERADRVLEATYRTSGVLQVPLEPHACLAEVDGDRWTVTTSTQTPFGVREDTAALLGVPEEALVVRGTWVGGGFGGKASALVEPYALVLAKAFGRPVKLALDYAEEFSLSRSTLPAVVRLSSAVSHGRTTARRVRMLLDTGASLPGRDFATGYAVGFFLGPYRYDAVELEGYAVRTNKPPFGPHRAPFVPQCSFVADSHMDELARSVGVDPIEFRRTNALVAGDRTPFGQTVGPFALEEALRRAREVRDRWRTELPRETGVGVGVGFWSTQTPAGGEAIVELRPDGVVIVQAEWDIGSGSVQRGLVAVAARVLGLPAEAIRVESRDTASAPYDSGVFGSRTVAALGQAVEGACRQLLAELVGTSESSERPRLRWHEGRLSVVTPGPSSPAERSVEPMSARGKHYGQPSGTIDPRIAEVGEFYPFVDLIATVGVAAVAVDRETGQVRPVRYAAILDAGTVIDAPTYRAQVEGGVAMGLGEALTEETIWGPDGRLENAGLLDYRIPTIIEVPPIDVEFIEGFPGAGPFGSKGGGEPPVIPVPAAVANAIADLTRVRLREMPFTPERVARALMVV